MKKKTNPKSLIYIITVFNPTTDHTENILEFSKELSKEIIETFPSDGFDLAGIPTEGEFYNSLMDEYVSGVGFAFGSQDHDYMESLKGFLKENIGDEAYIVEIEKREIEFGEMDFSVNQSDGGKLQFIGVPRVESIREVDHYEYWKGKEEL